MGDANRWTYKSSTKYGGSGKEAFKATFTAGPALTWLARRHIDARREAARPPGKRKKDIMMVSASAISWYRRQP